MENNAAMTERINRQSVVNYKDKAFFDGEFCVYYQPKFNQSTGVLVGAEALARWTSEELGFVSPAQFIPVFEEDDTITKLDLLVFEEVCRLLAECREKNYYMAPISVNFSRRDIFCDDIFDRLDSIAGKYNVDCSYITIEITESSALGSTESINRIIGRLHDRGYRVAMDDFGKGYSSLNVLRNLNIDEMKIDMGFIHGSIGDKGGIILSSVVNMAKWLQLPIVVEGVETEEQSDFLKSIGCRYVQGFLFSKPVTREEYLNTLSSSKVGQITKPISLIDRFNSNSFWDPRSLETLIFSNFLSGAAVFQYDCQSRKLEILRINEKYTRELGMNKTQSEIIISDPWLTFDEENRKVFEDALVRAIETKDEVSCDTWRTLSSDCCGSEHMCIRSEIRVIGQSDQMYLFYAMIRNITAEKEKYNELLHSDTIMRNTFDQVDIYYWELNLLNKEMRPCFRCMRNLGLPPLVKNYPDSAVELGIIPEEYADMYKEFVGQLLTGVDKIEAIVPLTEKRIPFRIRYTTEFDELGNPIRAFASATIV